MTVLVDTSAIYALLDEDDRRHAAAVDYFRAQIGATDHAVHNYVLVESIALVQHRLGVEAVRRLVDAIQPVFEVIWVDPDVHERAADRLLRDDKRRLSLVDQVSFEVMRRHGIDRAFAFDDDFGGNGFGTVP
jgi:predicted nucleic acid-binding protein